MSVNQVSFTEKIIPYADVEKWRNRLEAQSRPLVVTNGVFDILHLGHVLFLEAAKSRGAVLLVGITGDEGARALKGEGRPLVSQSERAAMVAALQSVSWVSIFPEIDACEFLKVARPDIYVKGGDYSLETMNRKERVILAEMGAKIEVLTHIQGRSTTGLIERIVVAHHHNRIENIAPEAGHWEGSAGIWSR
jgi:rfaE bifunctional protein nucleotidyltransferase chain/domain